MTIHGESSIGQIALRDGLEKKGHRGLSELTGISVCRLYELASGRKKPTRMGLHIAKSLYDNLGIEPFSWFVLNDKN